MLFFSMSNTFICMAQIGKQHPETELLTNMFKKQVFLYQYNYMISCDVNQNDNGKRDHINKTYRPRRRHRDKYRKYRVSW